MKNPTRQELMEFVDGTLMPQRQVEIERLVRLSESLQKEVNLLRAMNEVVRHELTTPSKYFTIEVMREVLPVRHESLLFRMAKNSSNIFAMVLVLSLIAIVLVSSPNPASTTTNPLTQSLDSFSSVYNNTMTYVTNWTKEYSHPLGEASKTSSGKIFFIGIIIFSLYALLDRILSKRHFHARMKN